MSYPGEPAPDPMTPAPRPAVVTLAAAVMVVMGIVGLVNALAGLATMQGIVERFRIAAQRTDASPSDIDAISAFGWMTVIVAAVVGVVLAVLLTVLAVGNLRGSNGARIATWIVCGLGLICGCCGLVVAIGQSAVPVSTAAGDRVTQDLLRALTEEYPPWWVWLNAGLSAAQALGYLVVALLLALPAANAFFRRTPAQRQQPIPPTPELPPMPPTPPM